MSLFSTGCGPGNAASKDGGGASVPLEAQGLGAAATGLLRNSPYSKLVIEVASVKGQEPSTATMDFVQSFLVRHVNKSDGIEVVVDPPIPATGTGGLSIADLQSLESANRKRSASGSTVSVFIMFLDNHALDDSATTSTLGLAYQSTSMAIFAESIQGVAGALNQALASQTVIAHEFGHVFGLVNLGTPMVGGVNHYDSQHGTGHCTNPKCLMNYAVHSSGSWGLVGSTPPDFDTDCLNDLKAAGGK